MELATLLVAIGTWCNHSNLRISPVETCQKKLLACVYAVPNTEPKNVREQKIATCFQKKEW